MHTPLLLTTQDSGLFEGSKKTFQRKLEKELTLKVRLAILDKCPRDGRERAALERRPNHENIIV
ncbi:hypothetical protein A6770_32720 [Nostoc minutum NIES-26]|uniref:Uncharacterized protein n=1 Tax=Nostoc minutum NIES-26 TaxID=1844469 RepID=A0A367Q4K9_9NOSO|nr:hypothetical protein A6770_32720 [Nostoc minutum NIES-26]